MSSTFDASGYRSELDKISFSAEQKSRMAQRLANSAESAPASDARPAAILEMSDATGARSSTHRASRSNRTSNAAHTVRRRSKVSRIAAVLGIAAMLTLGGGAAYATGTLARATDSLASVFGAGPAQTELINRIGRPIGASCTSSGITITADAIIGMRHAYAVIYTVEKDDGTAFDELTVNKNDSYNLKIEGGGSINALTAVRLGMKGMGGTSFTFDADPSDNALQYVELMSIGESNSALVGETLHFSATELAYIPTSEDGQRDLPRVTLATGNWDMSFKIDYEDLSVDLPSGQQFTVNGNNAVVDELAISPLGATITYTVDAVDGPSEPSGLETNPERRAGHGDLTVTFTDGTVQELGSGYSSWPQDGKTVVQKTWFFDQIHELDDIQSITVGDLTVPVK